MPVSHSNSLRIFSLNIGFWVDSSFLSILSLAAFVIFLSLVFSMKFFVFFPFKDCWVSWIYSFMSFIKFEIFSHYFFRYFFHHTASPLLKECGVRPLDVVPPVWSSVPFFFASSVCFHWCSVWTTSLDPLEIHLLFTLSSPLYYWIHSVFKFCLLLYFYPKFVFYYSFYHLFFCWDFSVFPVIRKCLPV